MPSEWIVISVDRTDEEKREAYAVDWQPPANRRTLADRIREVLRS